MSERVDDYDFEHPGSAVAQEPAARREDARLLHVRRFALERGGEPVLADARIPDLSRFLRDGDLLVVNDTWVAPAKLTARRDTGGRVSVLVLDSEGDRVRALLGARGQLRPGEVLEVEGDRWELVEPLGDGRFALRVLSGRPVAALLDAVGRMPLPPYIRRDPDHDPRDDLDRERYQSRFAQRAEGEAGGQAVAAPTASLHFTPELMEDLQRRGVTVGRLRLDVGEGTFRPLRGETLDEHAMHAERYAVSESLAEQFASTRAAGGRVVAVGTTVVRTLETVVDEAGRQLRAGSGETRLFIRPGFRFRAVDALLTNFHQPRSTLLVLVSAFAGRETIRHAYDWAIQGGYRLFSYGDAMLLAGDDSPGLLTDPGRS